MARSDYYLTLSGDVKCRYDQKLQIIDNIDPYVLSAGDYCVDLCKVPNITMMDLVNYLILTNSFYSGQQLKAYKSLQAYKQYESGSIQRIIGKQINENAFVVISKVQHSQKKKEKLLEVWVIILKDTSISSAHCTCMAGLSEVCSHVATVLFCLHARPNTIDESVPAPTDKLSVWPVPPMKNVEMLRIRDMDWKRKSETVVLSQKHAPSLEEQNKLFDFFTKAQEFVPNPAICRLLEPFASAIESSNSSEPENLPNSLDSLYSPDMVGKSYEDQLALVKNFHMEVSTQQVDAIDAATRGQSQNNTWFKFRSGRITASQFKAVCRTSLENPSLTVIKGVCYPHKVVFNSKQTSYGVKYENTALQEYKHHLFNQHTNFVMSAAGFIISQKHPEVGASPDGLVSCDCCGLGCVEVKCPYLLVELDLEQFASKRHTCLIFNNGKLALDIRHCYYYQVQCQMFVTNRKYCDFVIWSKKLLYIERILYNENFVLENLRKALDFHNFIIKPELLSRYFTEKGGLGRLTLWCLCQKPDDLRPMLRCDNDNCDIQWFHFECVNLVNHDIPSTWVCNNCS